MEAQVWLASVPTTVLKAAMALLLRAALMKKTRDPRLGVGSQLQQARSMGLGQRFKAAGRLHREPGDRRDSSQVSGPMPL